MCDFMDYIGSIIFGIFDDAENYLLYTSSGQSYMMTWYEDYFHDETCKLLSLYYNDISLKSQIRNIFMINMYKFRDLNRNNPNNIYSLIHEEIGPIIQEAVDNQNITKSEIIENCKYSSIMQKKIKAMLLSFFYIFSDAEDVGAGDMATGPYTPTIHADTHTKLTGIFNDMVDG